MSSLLTVSIPPVQSIFAKNKHSFLFLNQMKPLAIMLCSFWSISLQVTILLSSSTFLFQPASAFVNESDHLALLKFKESISNDPYHILSSWNTSTHLCNWPGISCGHRHPQRITSLNLEGYGLHGSISPHIGNLSFLRILNLQNNSFKGMIPQEVGRLFRLQKLWLTNNTLTGEIPSNLTSCSELRILWLDGNRLVGKIPMEIGSLRKLQWLDLFGNNLTGRVPASMWNVSSLSIIAIDFNNLDGNIPEEIGHLKLAVIGLGVNQFSGRFPSSLYNVSSLKVISVPENRFNGSLPSNLFLTLPNLMLFEVGVNQMFGPIPSSISNASKLQIFDIDRNSFLGSVPNFGMLQDLQKLLLGGNNLGSNSSQDLEFLKSLINCTALSGLSLANNNFGGSLPNSMGNFSNQLKWLYLGGNQISGKIPETLGNLINLTLLGMQRNSFTGNVPITFGKFEKMQELFLTSNQLSGEIPTTIGNLTQLSALSLSRNMLEGNIPPSIENCKALQYLDFSQNKLTGVIPSQVISIFSLSILLNLSHNSLTGNLPAEVSKLENIDNLDVSENRLSGDIPAAIGDCLSLEYLNLQGNSFYGSIPSSLASLKGLQHLDLSRNNLSGLIPKALQNISVLEYLNVSYNMLNGEVPKEGIFRNASALSVNGNDKLCGGISELHLPPCPNKVEKQSKHHSLLLIVVIVSLSCSFLLLPTILTMYWMRKRTRKSSSSPPMIEQFSKVSYQILHHATNGFSANNLIGSGCHGLVYKGSLESEENLVAIKVLNLQKKGAHKSFIAECSVLRSIRHRNLVKILTCCSSIDHKGLDFEALVFEYMTNGSLEQWLHPRIESPSQQNTLSLVQRVNILIDIGFALHYLHHECEQPIIHCDLKPSNVLLDDDMVGHVSDFGLARILSTKNGTSRGQTSTIGIKGTIGYAPPEYGIGSQVSAEGDLYSFGILVLEMLTRRRPIDEIFKGGQNLHNYVKMAFPNNLLQIVDRALILRKESREGNMDIFTFHHHCEEKCLVSLFRMGLSCSVESPKERMNMEAVMKELNVIRNTLRAGGIN